MGGSLPEPCEIANRKRFQLRQFALKMVKMFCELYKTHSLQGILRIV